MEVNKEEALRCLHIAQRHRTAANLPSALKFAQKSVSLYSTPEGEALVSIVTREIAVGGTSSQPEASSSKAKASGVEEHVTSAQQRPGHTAESSAPKKREYTAKQIEVVKRVKGCKAHEYYEILACTSGSISADGSGTKMRRERRQEGVQKAGPRFTSR